jgi:hypothetical protein
MAVVMVIAMMMVVVWMVMMVRGTLRGRLRAYRKYRHCRPS